MCRLFAVQADRPVSAVAALVTAPHSLVKQSCGDDRGECHPNGWGIGYYVNELPVRVRSTLSAMGDPAYRKTAELAISPTIIGHVRQASVGRVSEANTHPFVHGRWLFAHNGTIQGFSDNPGPLLGLIPEHHKGLIEGETDSEHLFHALLGRIEGIEMRDVDALAGVLGTLLHEVVQLYPGSREEPTRLNVVLTDGITLLASRWGHVLHLTTLEHPEVSDVVEADGRRAPLRGVAIASEPTATQGWTELPEQSVVIARANGSYSVIQLSL